MQVLYESCLCNGDNLLVELPNILLLLIINKTLLE